MPHFQPWHGWKLSIMYHKSPFLPPDTPCFERFKNPRFWHASKTPWLPPPQTPFKNDGVVERFLL
jgi:hypothetical protein